MPGGGWWRLDGARGGRAGSGRRCGNAWHLVEVVLLVPLVVIVVVAVVVGIRLRTWLGQKAAEDGVKSAQVWLML